MTVHVQPLIHSPLSGLISASGVVLSDRNAEILDFCQTMSGELWNGFIDDEYICTWGLVPPTVFSTQAYIWMYATPAVRNHQFLFIRRSQIVIEGLLERYESLIGHCFIESHSSRKWLRFLGAEFGEPNGNIVPFTIRRRSRG